MPRRSPKRPVHALKSAVLLPDSTADEYIVKPAEWWPEITHLTDQRWAGIEKAYGHPLSSEVRRALLESIYCFIVLARMESAGASAKAVDKRLADIRKRTKALLTALTAEGDTALLTHDLIEQAGVDLERLRGLLIVLEHGCDRLPILRPHKEGEAWDAWVRELMVICEKHGLPTAARQDDEAERKPSAP